MNAKIFSILFLIILSSESQAQDFVNIVKFFSNNFFQKSDQDDETTKTYNQFLEIKQNEFCKKKAPNLDAFSNNNPSFLRNFSHNNV